MNSDTPSDPSHRYLVRVGHNQVLVVCANAKEAINRARKQLCSDFPRLWDVISNLADNKFEVREVPS